METQKAEVAQDRDLDLCLSSLLLSQFAGCQVNDARSRFGWGFGRCAQASLEEEEHQDDGNSAATVGNRLRRLATQPTTFF